MTTAARADLPNREALLSVRDLHVRFRSGRSTVEAVNGVSFDVRPGEHLGLVGESGSGKSATALSILGLLPAGATRSGSIVFAGQELIGARETALRAVRGAGIAMIYQDPFSSLNPVMTIERQLTEAVTAHRKLDRRASRLEAVGLLEVVGVPDPARRARNYPHEFSGGMRQRVIIAMALAGKPRLLLADEPTTALDVTTQAQILELLLQVAGDRGMALMLITHDLGVVARIANRISVMYAGRVVESGGTRVVFSDPGHPYTVGLLGSLPRVDRRQARLQSIPGQPPDMARRPSGCAFAARCARRLDRCSHEDPPLTPRAGSSRDAVHVAACWNPPALHSGIGAR